MLLIKLSFFLGYVHISIFSGHCSYEEMWAVFLPKYCGFLIKLKAYAPANSIAQTGLSLDDVIYVQIKIN